MSTVLVVDDEPQIARTLRINFTARGYQVIVAHDGISALRAANETKPDVVVLDLGLPDIHGTTVIERLRRWSTVPIIVLSVRTDSSDKVAALDAGRRRLHHQTVRHGRTARPAARRRPPRHHPGVRWRQRARRCLVDLASWW